MKLDIKINGVPGALELFDAPPRCRFRMDGAEEREADVETPEPGVYSILMDGRSFEVRIEERPDALVALIDGFRFEIEVRDPRRFARRSGAAGGDAAAVIAAPMPGKVVRLLVAQGDTVEAGQGVIVVEAMKMQNEMKAPRAGSVLSLPAKEGDTVAAGDTLATIG